MTKDDLRSSLRERKKTKTRDDIQRNAMRLFREQGYEATTVDQIAEASEISQTTFFRYFPRKEDVILDNNFRPRVFAAFKAQPVELAMIPALRGALHALSNELTPAELKDAWERRAFVLAIPQLRAIVMDDLAQTVRVVIGVLVNRTGRDPDEIAVRTMAGALTGVMFSALFYWMEHPDVDLYKWVDEALACLEGGLSL